MNKLVPTTYLPGPVQLSPTPFPRRWLPNAILPRLGILTATSSHPQRVFPSLIPILAKPRLTGRMYAKFKQPI